MLQVQNKSSIVREVLDTPEVVHAYFTNAELEAIESFGQFRIHMNPRFLPREQWPRVGPSGTMPSTPATCRSS
jgi:hypothetical protein